MSETNWSDVSVSELLPSGTVTLLLADVQGSTQLWETAPDEMADAVTRLDAAVADATATHSGVRPLEQGEGDSFVIAFARASDAVACALQLQQAPLAPIRLRIGLHTGEVQLRSQNSGEANYIGPTINRTARLRDLAHGGQTVLSAATGHLVVDQLPVGASLSDLGSHPLKDLPRPEQVMQLCHPDLCNEFPPLRVSNTVAAPHLPVQLTSFVGREDAITQVSRLLADSRLVTLTGAGGVGKTRLAVHLASDTEPQFTDGSRYVDLASITDPDVVAITVIRALGLSDQLGRPTMDTLLRFVSDRDMLIVLDNCEHLLDAVADLVAALLGRCGHLTLLATSREPIGVPGEATWRVPSLPLADEALELFADRARLARPDFVVTEENTNTVMEICRRLDGMPLAIELAAARVRALSLNEILDSLHDHFMLLTGGARTSVRRQQTLRASVDWSHALLTDTERILFRRLAAFMGGFDLDAARVVASGGEIAPFQILDQLTLLVDKSLVIAEDARGRTRYRLLETVRQYAQEKLGESGEASAVRFRHRDYYSAKAVQLNAPPKDESRWRMSLAEADIDNLRAAFSWSRDNRENERALQLASALWPLWVSRGRLREAFAWFDAALAADDESVQPASRAWALAHRVMLHSQLQETNPADDAMEALTIARDIGDPALIAHAVLACASTAGIDLDFAQPYIGEAIEIARSNGDQTMLATALTWHGQYAHVAGKPIAALSAAEEGRLIGEQLGHRYIARGCRWAAGWARMAQGELRTAAAELLDLAADASRDADAIWAWAGLFHAAEAQVHLGDIDGARDSVDAVRPAVEELGGNYQAFTDLADGLIAIAAGDIEAAHRFDQNAWRKLDTTLSSQARISAWRRAAVALAHGETTAARHLADEAVKMTSGSHRAIALTTRARVAIAQGDVAQAESDAHSALIIAVEVGALLGVSDTLDCLATLACQANAHAEAARLFGAADGIRQRTGEVRFQIFQAAYDSVLEQLRNAMQPNDFDATWTEGTQLSTDEAIGYAQRGRGERKRPSSGWESLTPAELDVARLVCEGLGNKEVAAQLFVSPRTVQAHLSHIYTKLGVSTRVQLANAARTRTATVD
ncbi:LuxR family transcriptional regulator [Mycobacterium barrassiae]|nr:LuxR family transcriptional regulator [Mycobacterium barrassiae]MCV7299613.1 LuxR family transcriptional regulator [Mycobacterium barrassiae]